MTSLAEVTATYRGHWRRGIADMRARPHTAEFRRNTDIHIDHDWVTTLLVEKRRDHRKRAMIDRADRFRRVPRRQD